MSVKSRIQRALAIYFLSLFLIFIFIFIHGFFNSAYADSINIINPDTGAGIEPVSPGKFNVEKITHLPNLEIKSNQKDYKKTDPKVASNHYDFSQENIQQSGEKNITHFLNQQGLISVKNSSGVNNQDTISMHGFGANANQNSLIQIDGIPDISLNNVSPVFNILMLQNIGAITILPGSYGASDGNQAVGGVVNIDTLSPNFNHPIHQVALGLGNNNQALASLFYSERYLNHLGVNLGFSGSQDDHTQDHQDQEHYIANGKLDYIGARGTVSFNFLGYQDHSQIPGYFTVDGPATPANPADFINSKGALAYLNSQYFLSPEWSWKSALASNNNHSDGFLNSNFQNDQSQWLIQNSVNYGKFFTLGNQLDFAEYKSQSESQSLVINQNANEIDNAVFTTGVIPVSAQWDLNLGLRYASQYLDANPTPSIHATKNSDATVSTEGLTWHIQENLSWYVRRAGSFVFPKGDEQMWTNSPTLPLQTQTGVSYETGLDWKPNKNQLKLSVYQLDINNEISMYTPVSSPFPTMSNLPPTRRIGLDALGDFFINSRWALLTEGNLVSPRFRSGQYEGKQIPSVSTFEASTGLSYQTPQDWTLLINETYNGSYYADEDFTNSGPKQAGYFLTNFNMTKTYQEITLGLSINNLFDTHFASYAYAFGDNPTQVNYYMGDGISLLGSVTMNF